MTNRHLSVKTGWIKNRFGSKKGLLLFTYHQMLYWLGFYRHYKNIDFSRVRRLVFVCQGNICRSPLGEAVARSLGVKTFSFGLDTRGDAPADPRAITWAETNGYALESHRTRRVENYVPEEGDLLIAMEPKHANNLKNRFSYSSTQITLAGLWLRSPMVFIQDPFNTNSKYFSLCEIRVAKASEMLASAFSRASGNTLPNAK